MPKPNLDTVLEILDPMLSDNFDIIFQNLPAGVEARPLQIQCKTAIKPGTTIEEVAVELFGHRMMHVGRKTFSNSLQIEFVDDRNGKIHEMMEAWAEFCRETKTQHGHFKADYAADAEFYIYDQEGTKVKTYKIYNIWPSQVPDMQFDGSSAQAINVQMEFKYDYYEEI